MDAFSRLLVESFAKKKITCQVAGETVKKVQAEQAESTRHLDKRMVGKHKKR